jgi:ribonuclease HI
VVLANVDASFKPENLDGGIGAVIRDEAENFIAACNDPINYAIDTNTLEVTAVSRGLPPGGGDSTSGLLFVYGGGGGV